MLRKVSFLCFLSFLHTSPGFSQARGVSLQSLDASPDCGPVRHRVDNFLGQSSQETFQSLKVFFDDFSLSLEQNPPAVKICELSAKILVPAGVQFRAASAGIFGVAELAPNARASVDLSYTLEELGSRTRWEIDLEGFQDFNGTVEMNDPRYTACSPRSQVVTLKSRIFATIYQHQSGFSFLSLDQNNQDSSIAWDWRAKPCPGVEDDEPTGGELFEQTFTSFYRVGNGRNIRATINLNGSSGTFQSSAGFTGQFRDVRYSQSGRVAEGTWEGQSQTGTFRFEIVDPSSGRFTGTFTGSNGSGTWTGSYE